MNLSFSLDDLPQIAAGIMAAASSKTLLIYGEMGVGKTTLIKEIAKQLGVEDRVSSPTFSIVNEYRSNSGETVYHFDFYRLKKEEEAFDIGLDDYFGKNTWCLIEWPEKVKNLLPLNAIEIHLSKKEDGIRTISIKP